jgi:hypothetical protein
MQAVQLYHHANPIIFPASALSPAKADAFPIFRIEALTYRYSILIATSRCPSKCQRADWFLVNPSGVLIFWYRDYTDVST